MTALTALALSASVVQPAAAEPVRAASGVSASHPGAQKKTKGAAAGDIQSVLLKFAAQKLAGFAFSKLGLDKLLNGNDQDLADLRAEIAKISGQVKELQDSLNQISSDLAKLTLEGFTVPLGQTVSKIKSLYMDFYVPALDALTAYAAKVLALTNGQTCDEVSVCLESRKVYEGLDGNGGLRGDFLKQFTAEGPASYNIQIHDALLPGPAGSSAMTAYGLVVARSGTGFLTSADSAAIVTFYNYFAEYEALAAWMKGQWQSSRLTASAFDDFLKAQIEDYQKAEHDALPPPIPANAVIALPANAALRTSDTKNMPMWGFNQKSMSPLSWDPYNQFKGVAENLQQMNADAAAGYGLKDWQVPSRSQLDALLSRGAAGTTAREFLLSLNPGWPTGLGATLSSAPYLWTTQGAGGSPAWAGSPATICTGFTGTQFVVLVFPIGYMHTAVGPVTGSLAGYPAQYRNYNRPDFRDTEIKVVASSPQAVTQLCYRTLNDKITKFFTSGSPTVNATLLATRSTGSVNYLP
jgi:hypothetical protein